jgi:hypothetical protein
MRLPRPLLILFVLAGVLFFSFTGLFGLVYYKVRDVKEPLLGTLKQYIEGDLQIEDAEVVFFPAGIDLTGVKLFAPNDPEPAATVPEAKLRFNLIPLLQKKIETRLTLVEPVIHLKRSPKGKSNMEVIFSPVIASDPDSFKKSKARSLEDLWWRRLAIEELTIEKAHFISSKAGSDERTEFKNIDIQADRIRFESSHRPAELKIRYEMPQFSKAPMELKTQMRFVEQDQAMHLQDGVIAWGPLKVDLHGKALLPSEKNREVVLDFDLLASQLRLEDLNQVLKEKIPVEGTVALKGKVTGTPFAPQLSLTLDSPALNAKGITLSGLHAELSKNGVPVELKNSSFGIYGGKVAAEGSFLPGKKTSADLNIKMQSLSVAAISGKKGMPARLSGQLKLKSPEVQNPQAYSGGGPITVGPIPLPAVDLSNKIRIAEVLAAGTQMGSMVNVGMLKNSANIIGTQVDQIRANISIAGGNISLHPFSAGNGHFSASGNGQIIQQKNINAGGTFTMNQGVTRQLIPDPMLRKVMTDGRNQISFPFSLSGPLSNPNVSVDSSGLKGKMAAATALILQRQLMGGINPQNMVNSALKGTALGDPNNPLGQLLGGQPQQQQTTQQPTTQTRTTRQTSNSSTASTKTQTQTQKKSVTGNSLADQLLFGR